jgi:hypothetical protein
VVDEEVIARQGLKPKAPRGRHSGKAVSSIFQGLGTCAFCGSSFVRVSKGKYTYLVCSKAHAKGGCEYRSVPYDEAENAIRQNIEAIIESIPRGQNTEELEGRIEGLEIEVDEGRSELEALVDDFSRTRSPTIRESIQRREKQIEEKAEELKALRAQRDELASGMVLKRIERLKQAFSQEPFDKGKAHKALTENIKEVRFDGRFGLIKLRWQNGEWQGESIPIPAVKFAKGVFGGSND